MRILHLLAIIPVVLLATGCKEENRLPGKYSISVYSVYDKSTDDTLTLDFKDKSAFTLLRDYTPSSWSVYSDEEYFQIQQKCYLELREDGTFFLRDLGFIFPNKSFILNERELNGTWKFDKGSQNVTMQVSPEINKKFKLGKYSIDSLYLSENVGDLDIGLKLIRK